MIVMTELMTVLTKRKRPPDIAGKWRKTAKMIHPGGIVQRIQTDRRSRTVIAPAKDVLGERGGLDTPVEAVVEIEMYWRGTVFGHQPYSLSKAGCTSRVATTDFWCEIPARNKLVMKYPP